MPPSYEELKNRDMRDGAFCKSEPTVGNALVTKPEATLDDVINGVKALNAALRELMK